MSSAKLYEIAQDFQIIFMAMERIDGEELSTESIQEMAALQNQLSVLNLEFEMKVENIAKYITNLNYSLAGIKNEIERLNSRKKTIENRIDWLKEYVKSIMKQLNVNSVVTNLFTVHIQNNSQPSVVIEDESKIGDEFRIGTLSIPLQSIPSALLEHAKIETSRTAIREHITNNGPESVPGATLKLGNHLRIR